jgi:hypothetical protein
LQDSSADTYIENYVQLSGAVAPWDSNGLPVFGNVTSQYNFLDDVVNSAHVGTLDYTITSLTPAVAAPEIDPTSMASGLTLLLGGLVALRGRRSVTLNNAAAGLEGSAKKADF